MRTTATLSIALLSMSAQMLAQAPGDSLHMFFDDASDNLQLDSVYPEGCWQVGMPSKQEFTSAYSPGRALVTDTLLPYPDSTTCYAEFTLISTDLNFLGRSVLFQQRLDMSQTDTAWVEVYIPWASQWVRYGTNWDEGAFVDGMGMYSDGSGYAWSDTSSAWQEVWLESPCMGVFAGHEETDARWYEPEMRLRFVFRSQANVDGRDGWMIDNIRAGVSICGGGVEENTAESLSVFPVPASDRITLNWGSTPMPSGNFDVLDGRGAVVRQGTMLSSANQQLDIHDLVPGVYTVRAQAGLYRARTLFCVQR